MRRGTVRWLSRLHTALFRATGGRVGRRLVDNDMLLLTTVGRRSGRRRTVPLLYLRHGTGLIVIASYGGRSHHPDWYHNLTAHPEVTVQVDGRRRQMTARTATSEERADLWPKVLDAYDGYREYQQRTDRQIPVVILE